MPQIQPDFESVFTQDYWGKVPPMHKFEKDGSLARVFELSRAANFNHGRADSQTLANVGEALARTALQIYAGDNPGPIEEDELIGGREDDSYALPGNVLLLDTEKLTLCERHYEPPPKAIANSFEIAASAVRLLRSNTRRELAYETSYFPGIQGIPKNLAVALGLSNETRMQERDDPVMIVEGYDRWAFQESVGVYSRAVNLVAFFPDRKGRIGSRMAGKSFVLDSGGAHSWLWSVHPHRIGRVGQVTNRSVNDKVVQVGRIRSAYICARAAFEYAAVPAKARKYFLVGRLSLRPN